MRISDRLTAGDAGEFYTRRWALAMAICALCDALIAAEGRPKA
jgi:hypothetical protein